MPIAAIVLSLLLLAGCATSASPGLQDEQRRSTIAVSGADFTYELELTEAAHRRATELPGTAAEAWRILPAIYEDLGIPLRTVRPDARLLGAERWAMPSRVAGERRSAYLDCGRSIGGTHADTHRVTAAVHSQVHPTADGIRLETRVSASARPRDVSGNPGACSSTGRLEGLIAAMLAQRLLDGR